MNIQEIYDYAKLATLAYVDLSEYSRSGFTVANIINEAASKGNPGDTQRIPTKLGTQMFAPTAQISADITGKWTVLDPYFKTSGASGHSDPASGFAAMLVRNDTTGKKVLAIAGTEPGGPNQKFWDLAEADFREIGFWGAALGQIVSLYNYVQVLRAAPGALVDQLVLKETFLPPANKPYLTLPGSAVSTTYIWLEKSTTQASGLGLINANEQLTVTGHSLGGHLSAMAVALFPDLFTSAVTFNAPGYNPLSSLINFPGGGAADKLLGLFTQFGANPATVSSISGRISTFESEDASTGDDWDAVSGDVTGTPFSAEQYVTVEKNTHDVGHMMDGLALQALFAQLDPSLDRIRGNQLIKAASSETGKSYEELLRKLYLLVTGNPLTGVTETYPSKSMVDAGVFAARSSYYDKLIELANKDAFKTLSGKLTIQLSSASLDSIARSDFSAFLSLYNLSPFYLKTNGISQDSLNAALGAANSDMYGKWQADNQLTAAQRAAGLANFSDSYLHDRAVMLAWVVKANTEDGGSKPLVVKDDNLSDAAWFYEDRITRTTMLVRPSGLYFGENRKVVFGKDDADTINGGLNTDRLYGGGGGNDFIYATDGYESTFDWRLAT